MHIMHWKAAYLFLLFMPIIASSPASLIMNIAAADLSNKAIGIIGVGKIGSCIVKGYATAPRATCVPRKIVLSPRGEKNVKELSEEFSGSLVEVARSNQEVVEKSDIIFIGLLPAAAKEILPTLAFDSTRHIVISMMATIDMQFLLEWTHLPQNNIVRTVPLPSCARQTGPILQYPKNSVIEAILSIVGTPVACSNEQDMKPMVAMTGHISSFYELMRVTQDWCVKEGVDEATARLYVSSFYSSLAQATLVSKESLHAMCEEAITPGGINEQTMKFLRGNSDHYKNQEESLTAILDRLKGIKK